MARSTAILFGLPSFCHYGIGGPGYGAWRELTVHEMTTDWVLAGDCEGFPLMYHWRVVPDSTPRPEELSDVDGEYIPQNVFQWLGEQINAGDEAADRACAMVGQELETTIAFMNDRGLLHFDAHFQNRLTDGTRLFFADYGLAISSRFDLSDDESAFLQRHHDYDRGYAAMYMAQWLVATFCGSWREGEPRLRAYARGEVPTGIPTTAATILARDAPVEMTDLLRALQRESRHVDYPYR